MRRSAVLAVLLLFGALAPPALTALQACAVDWAMAAARRAASDAAATGRSEALPPALRDGSLVAGLP
jgi:hypothetical protein